MNRPVASYPPGFRSLIVVIAVLSAGVLRPEAAVGYLNLDLPAGYSLITNPLDTGSNELGEVLPSVPDGTSLFKFDGNGFEEDSPIMVDGFGWFRSSHDPRRYYLEPGEGAFLYLPQATKVTFVGDILSGTLSVPLPSGFSMIASKVPQAGTLTDLGFPAIDGDFCFRWRRDQQMFDPNPPQFIDGYGWFPVEPFLGAGEAFFLFRSGPPGVWVREFSLNN